MRYAGTVICTNVMVVDMKSEWKKKIRKKSKKNSFQHSFFPLNCIGNTDETPYHCCEIRTFEKSSNDFVALRYSKQAKQGVQLWVTNSKIQFATIFTGGISFYSVSACFNKIHETPCKKALYFSLPASRRVPGVLSHFITPVICLGSASSRLSFTKQSCQVNKLSRIRFLKETVNKICQYRTQHRLSSNWK